jgi:transcription elongation factor Elf1
MKTCPVCGSEDVSTTYETFTIAAPYAAQIAYRAAVDTCVSCLETGDFEAENDARIEDAYARSVQLHIEGLLKTFESHGVSRVTICYALKLCPTTMFSTAAEAALLRMLLERPEYLDEEWEKQQ